MVLACLVLHGLGVTGWDIDCSTRRDFSVFSTTEMKSRRMHTRSSLDIDKSRDLCALCFKNLTIIVLIGFLLDEVATSKFSTLHRSFRTFQIAMKTQRLPESIGLLDIQRFHPKPPETKSHLPPYTSAPPSLPIQRCIPSPLVLENSFSSQLVICTSLEWRLVPGLPVLEVSILHIGFPRNEIPKVQIHVLTTRKTTLPRFGPLRLPSAFFNIIHLMACGAFTPVR